MKNLKQILLAILVLTFIASCEKDENESSETLEAETISAKWIVDETSDYESFEFTESGNYLVVKNSTTTSTDNQIVLYGTYEITNNTTIVLSDFGTIKISEINDNSMSFSLQLSDSDSESVFVTSKQEEMESSTNTELLCRTWELVSVNEISVTGTSMELTVLFSKAGTYFVPFQNPKDGNYGSLAPWKWKDEAETQILYSLDEDQNWDEESYAQITELTSNSLKYIDWYEIYEFQPVSNTK